MAIPDPITLDPPVLDPPFDAPADTPFDPFDNFPPFDGGGGGGGRDWNGGGGWGGGGGSFSGWGEFDAYPRLNSHAHKLHMETGKAIERGLQVLIQREKNRVLVQNLKEQEANVEAAKLKVEIAWVKVGTTEEQLTQADIQLQAAEYNTLTERHKFDQAKDREMIESYRRPLLGFTALQELAQLDLNLTIKATENRHAEIEARHQGLIGPDSQRLQLPSLDAPSSGWGGPTRIPRRDRSF